ncbi:MAG: hypothetical protein RSC35_04075 [Mucinivorans sp.]
MGDFFKSHDSARRLHGDLLAAPLAPSGLLLSGTERLHAERFFARKLRELRVSQTALSF